MLQATFRLQKPSGNGKPEGVSKGGCPQSCGSSLSRYLHAPSLLCARAGCSHPHLPSAEPARVSSWEPCSPGPEEGDPGHRCGIQCEGGAEGNAGLPAHVGIHRCRGAPLPAPWCCPAACSPVVPSHTVRSTGWLCKQPVAHVIQAVTVLLVLQPSPYKPGEHLGFRAELQELQAAMMLPMVAAQEATKPEGTTPGLGSPQAASRWWLDKYC